MNYVILQTIVLLLSVYFMSCSAEFDYMQNGPDQWFLNYPSCKGEAQSPINIITQNLVLDQQLSPFQFVNLNSNFTWTLYPPGHNSLYIFLIFSKFCISIKFFFFSSIQNQQHKFKFDSVTSGRQRQQFKHYILASEYSFSLGIQRLSRQLKFFYLIFLGNLNKYF